MKRFLFLLLALCLSANAAVFNNTYTTNSVGKTPTLLTTSTNTLFPLMILNPDGSGSPRDIQVNEALTVTGNAVGAGSLRNTNFWRTPFLDIGAGTNFNANLSSFQGVTLTASTEYNYTNGADGTRLLLRFVQNGTGGFVPNIAHVTWLFETNNWNTNASGVSFVTVLQNGSTAEATLIGTNAASSGGDTIWTNAAGVTRLINETNQVRILAGSVGSPSTNVVLLECLTNGVGPGDYVRIAAMGNGKAVLNIGEPENEPNLNSGTWFDLNMFGAANKGLDGGDEVYLIGRQNTASNSCADTFVFGMDNVANLTDASSGAPSLILGGLNRANGAAVNIVGNNNNGTGDSLYLFGDNLVATASFAWMFGDFCDTTVSTMLYGSDLHATNTSNVIFGVGLTTTENNQTTFGDGYSGHTVVLKGASGSIKINTDGTATTSSGLGLSGQTNRLTMSGGQLLLDGSPIGSGDTTATNIVTLTQTGTNVSSLDYSLVRGGGTFKLQLTNNAYIGAPSGVASSPFSKSWLVVQQPSTGTCFLTFTNGFYQFPEGVAPIIDTNNGAVTIYQFISDPITNGLLHGWMSLKSKLIP